jgi:hypothetical protein
MNSPKSPGFVILKAVEAATHRQHAARPGFRAGGIFRK